jgi:beta-barrel assembly-enhancing protease
MKKIRIGRSRDNDVVINDSSVSRNHAEIFFDGSTYFITDLDSLNGTFINGTRIRGSRELHTSDIVKLGGSLVPWRNYFKSDFVSASGQAGTAGNSGRVQVSPPNYVPPVSTKKSRPPAFLLMVILGLVGFGAVYYFISRDGKKDEKPPDQITQKYPDSKLPEKEKINYDYSCMNSGGKSSGVINAGSEIDKEVTKSLDVEVTQNEEIEEGKNTYNQLIEEGYDIVPNSRVERILTTLKANFNPTYPYKIFEIKMEDINAFTVGGYIFVSSEMLRFVNNDDELAAVIGHEIFHNECGHIKKHLQKQKIATGIFGQDLGGFILGVSQLFTISFGQKDEVECDLHGLDICVRAAYDPCAGVELWKRMKQLETDEKSDLDNLFRSHPYSEVREGCNRNHLSTNYNINCK